MIHSVIIPQAAWDVNGSRRLFTIFSDADARAFFDVEALERGEFGQDFLHGGGAFEHFSEFGIAAFAFLSLMTHNYGFDGIHAPIIWPRFR